jgi:hypothetical protein
MHKDLLSLVWILLRPFLPRWLMKPFRQKLLVVLGVAWVAWQLLPR